VKSTGFYAELAKLPVQSAHPLPDDLPFELAALTEPAACCLSGVERLDLPAEASAVIIGGGIMGLLTMVLLRRRGVGPIILSDPLPGRREAAAALGADHVHDPDESDLREAVVKATGRGVHLAVEAVGRPDLVARCAELVRPRGEVLLMGVSPVGSELPIDLYDFHYREVRLQGAFGRGNVFSRAISNVGDLPAEVLLGERYPLSELPRAIADAARGAGVKLIVKPSG